MLKKIEKQLVIFGKVLLSCFLTYLERRNIKKRQEELGWEHEELQDYLDTYFPYDLKEEYEGAKREVNNSNRYY